MKGNNNCTDCDRLERLISEYEIEIDDLKLDLKIANEKSASNNDIQLQQKLEEKEEQFKREKKAIEKELSELRDILKKKDSNIKSCEKQIEENKKISQFIDQVLTAQKYSHGSVLDREAEINNLSSLLKEDIYPFLREIVHFDKESLNLFGEELVRWKIDETKYWLKDKKTIAFLGEFSAGKTTIVNRILSQDNSNVPQLPTSSRAMTAIPTYVCGGNRCRYQFVTRGHEIKEISESTFKMIDKELLSNIKGIGSLMAYLVLSYNNPNLQGLSILDTPGFSSNDEEDAKRTLEVINESDALFWVFDVNNGQVNTSSLNLIKQNLKKPLYIVINQIDTKSPDAVKSVENLISQTLKKEGLNIKGIIPFSKKNDLKDIMDPIKNIQSNSEASLYLERVRSFLNDIFQKKLVPNLKQEENKLNNLERMPAYNKDAEIKKEIDMNKSRDRIYTLMDAKNAMSRWIDKFEHECNKIKALE